VAGGVSLGAAVSYAHLLSPERAHAQTTAAVDDLYPLITLSIESTSLTTVRNEGRVQLKVTCGEELNTAFLEVFLRSGAGMKTIGNRNMTPFISSSTGGTRTPYVNISPSALTGLTLARLVAYVRAFDGENRLGLAAVRKNLS
jgi:hypothetical protein